MTDRKFSIYLAASSRELDLARSYMTRLRDIGGEITHDWPAVIDAHGGQANGDLADADKVAAANLKGVETCTFFWMLKPAPGIPSIGMWVELGAALAHKRFVIVSGHELEASIFTSRAHARFPTHEGAFSFIADTVTSLAQRIRREAT